MKSSFLMTLLVCSFLMSEAMGQTKKKNPKASKPSPVVATPAAVEVVAKTELNETAKTSFQKFSDRLKMSYFSAFQSSSLGSWESSKAIDEKGLKYADPIYTFNQISFNYNFGWKMNFVVNPRWTNWFGNTKNKDAGDDKSFFTVEDMLVGVQGVHLSSEDKKFNLWTRAGARLPTSRGSRASNITLQPEIMSIPTYDFDKTWQLGGYVQLRQWVYEQRYTLHRYRTYFAPYIQYSFNDTTRLQVFYETYIENRRRSFSQNNKKPIYKDFWQDAMVGVSWDVTPKFNFFPFLGYFVDARHISEKPMDPAWVGFWISYQIK